MGGLRFFSGTTECLADFLAPIEKVDSEFIGHFLATYRYFMSASDLMTRLIERFHKFKPIEGKADAAPEWSPFVQIRVLNVLRKWVSKYYFDFAESPEIEVKLKNFLDDIKQDSRFARYVQSIEEIIIESKKPEDKKEKLSDPTDINLSVRKKIQSISIIHLDPKTFAKQITLREMELFRSISFKEFLFQSWVNSKTNQEQAPNLLAYISWFNKTTNWVATEVCMASNMRMRINVVKFFITVAFHCASWNNFNTVFEIISGLNVPSVYRLKKMWSNLPAKYTKHFEALSAQLNPTENYKTYRATLNEAKTPCLPYIGVYLNDLIYAETGTETKLPQNKINFYKMTTISKALQSIIRFQEKGFSFPEDIRIQQWLEFSMVVMDEELLSKASLRCESE